MTKKTLMIYTDCPFFGGCETIIANILDSDAIRSHYDMTLAYRYSKEYFLGMQGKITKPLKTHPLYLINNQEYTRKLVKVRTRFGRMLVQICSKLIFIIHQFQLRVDIVIDFFILFAFFKKNKPDILHVNNGGYPASFTCRVAVFAAWLGGVKRIIFQVNNLAIPSRFSIEKHLDRGIAGRVKFFVTCSNAAGIRLQHARGFEGNKIVSIPNTIKDQARYETIRGRLKDTFGVPENILVSGSVGLLTHRKGMHVLLRCIIGLESEHFFDKINTRFYIFGEGEDRHFLEDIISRHGLEKRVFLPGFKPNVVEYMKDMDVLILPSLIDEDFPNVIIEAMLLQKPVIGTRVGGIPEQVRNNVNGLLVEPGSVKALIGAIKTMLSDREKMRNFGIEGHRIYYDSFEYNQIMKRYLRLYDAL